MTDTVADLLINIGINSEEAHKAAKKLDETTESVVELREETEETSEKGKKALSGLGDAAKKVGGALASAGKALGAGMATAAAGIAAAAVASTSMIMEQTHLAKAAGVTIHEFERLSHAASQNGVEAEDLKQGILDLRLGLDDVAMGAGGPAAEGLDRLGISLRDIKDLSAEDQFGMVADALLQVEDAGERGAIAMKVFGEDGGPKLLGLLAQGSEGIRQLGDAASHIDLADRMQIEQAVKDFDALKNQILVLLSRVLVPLIPSIQTIGKILGDLIQTLQKTGLFETLGKILGTLGTVVAELAEPLSQLIEMLLNSGVFDGLLETVLLLAGAVTETFDAIIPLLRESIELLPQIVAIVNRLIPPLIDVIIPALELMLALFTPMASVLEPVLTILEFITIPVGWLMKAFGMLIGLVKDFAKVLADAAKSFVLEDMGLRKAGEEIRGWITGIDAATESAMGLANVFSSIYQSMETRGRAAFAATFGQLATAAFAASPVAQDPLAFQREQNRKKNEVYRVMQLARNEGRDLTDDERKQINAVLVEGRLGALGTQEVAAKTKKAGKGKKKDKSEVELSEAILAIRTGQNDPQALARLAKQLSAKTPSTKDIKPTVAIDFYNLQITQHIKGSTDAKANQEGAMAAARKYFKKQMAKTGQQIATSIVR